MLLVGDKRFGNFCYEAAPQQRGKRVPQCERRNLLIFSTENRLLNMTFTFESDSQSAVAAVSVPLIPDIPTPRFGRVR
jgi:hypothetical protein